MIAKYGFLTSAVPRIVMIVTVNIEATHGCSDDRAGAFP